MNPPRHGAGPDRPAGPGRPTADVRLHLLTTGALVVAIAIVVTVFSIGGARADALSTISRPDTGLVLALLLGAIGVMGVLSALAVRVAGRPRQR